MGYPAMKLAPDLVTDAALVSIRVREARSLAHERAVKAIRGIERQVQQALAGDTLRGLSDLHGGEGCAPFHAACLRTTSAHGIDKRLPEDGREVLVIDKRGCIVWACRSARVQDHGWATRPANDGEFQAQDLEPVSRAVQLVLERHIARSTRAADGYERVAELSAKIAGAIGFVL